MIELAAPTDMRRWSRDHRQAGRRVGLVPTMGSLHTGHTRLVECATKQVEAVVVSVFVNPTQFGPQEDFGAYPRNLDADRAILSQLGVQCLFAPTEAMMYETPPAVSVEPGALAQHLCGPRRPGHFSGVLTVVAKLFNVTEPDVAVFGRKDVQQARIILRMVRDLSYGLRLVVVPTVREPDGLALSSRNAYLTPDQRAAAPRLAQSLNDASRHFHRGTHRADDLVNHVVSALQDEPLIDLEYVELVDPLDLAPVDTGAPESILALAAHVGDARLIDNVILGQGTDGDEFLDD